MVGEVLVEQPERVWQLLCGVHRECPVLVAAGEVAGALATAVGKPGSARAIGGAVGANPVPIIVGCHRVLASDGRITGYSGGDGIPTKLWLLGHERIGFAA